MGRKSGVGVVSSSAKPALYDRLSGRDNLAYSAELCTAGESRPHRPSRRAVRHRGRTRPAGGRLLDGNEDAPRAGAVRSSTIRTCCCTTSRRRASTRSRRCAVLELIHEMAGEGRTIVMCTHLLLEAEGLADQVVVLEGGRDIISGPPAELTRRYWPDTVVRSTPRTDPSALVARPDTRRARGRARRRRTRARPSRRPGAGARLVEALVAAGARVTRVEPFTPTLEDLYFAVRGVAAPWRAPRCGRMSRRVNWFRVRTIARTDLRAAGPGPRLLGADGRPRQRSSSCSSRSCCCSRSPASATSAPCSR